MGVLNEHTNWVQILAFKNKLCHLHQMVLSWSFLRVVVREIKEAAGSRVPSACSAVSSLVMPSLYHRYFLEQSRHMHKCTHA